MRVSVFVFVCICACGCVCNLLIHCICYYYYYNPALKYELFSILMHVGGAGGGHYFSYIKVGNLSLLTHILGSKSSCFLHLLTGLCRQSVVYL